MRKAITKLLTVASAMLFVVVLAACTPDKTDDLPPYPDLASFDADAGMAYPDTTAFDTSTGKFDNSTLTLEQVLNRARLAAGEIVSYKTRGTQTTRSSTSGFKEPVKEFSEIAANGNYRFGREHPGRFDDDVYLSQFRAVGMQNFGFNSNEGWKEVSEPRSEPRNISASDHFLRMFDQNDIELRSTNERTGDGVEVYRLEFSEQRDRAGRDDQQIQTITTTLLVSRESFRIIGMLRDAHDETYFVSAASEINPETHSRWIESVSITEYYDFNEPVVIEVPDEYVPWSQPVAAVQTP